MAFDDAMFVKYELGLLADEELRPNDTHLRTTWRAMRHNPVSDYIAPLIASGVSFFVCNNALSGFAFELARRSAGAAAPTRERVIAIHDELAAHFLPSTMLVPAGVAALIALQEARFTFVPS